MRAVDDVVLAAIRAVHPDVLNTATGKMESRVHDGQVVADNDTKVVYYPLPYVVYSSNLGTDDDRRLAGRNTQRSVFWSLMFVGIDRTQVKWLAEKVRGQIADRHLEVPGHKTRRIKLQSSQRVWRDDDAIRPDGSPLFYSVDEYDMKLQLSVFPALVEVTP